MKRDRAMQNSTAGPADVTEKQLQNRRGTNDLHAFRMLGPSHRVTNCSCALRTGRGGERMRDLVKNIGRNTADFLHHLRRVAGEMALQFLKNTLRILQCEIAWDGQVAAFVKPAVAFVSALFFVPA